DERRLRQRAHRLMRDDEHVAPQDALGAHAGGGEPAIGGAVRAEGEQGGVAVGRGDGGGGVHFGSSPDPFNMTEFSRGAAYSSPEILSQHHRELVRHYVVLLSNVALCATAFQ